MNNALMTKLIKNYTELDVKYHTNIDNSYHSLVNFSQTKNSPIHRWFYYQEGYSPDLVIHIFDHLGITHKKNTFVFDPFAGSGTTLLVSKQMGFDSYGFEINPFSSYMIKLKTRNYSASDLMEYKNFVVSEDKKIDNVYKKYELKIIKNLFDEDRLIDIEVIKVSIRNVKNSKVRDLLYGALLCILTTISNYRKGGNGLKRKKVNKNMDVFTEFYKKKDEIYADLNKVRHYEKEPNIVNDSCLNINNYDVKNIGISLFSPPYANCFDPFEVYKIELWVGEFVNSYEDLKAKRRQALTSNLNANLKKEFDEVHRTNLLSKILQILSNAELWDKRIIKMLDTYFFDMYCLLKEIYLRTKKSGYCVIVVGNSSYANTPVATDLILAELGEKVGFTVKEIIVGRTNETSSQQHLKIGDLKEYIRESLVVLQK